MLAVNKSTCSNMVYGELGITPLDIDIQARLIVYWAKINGTKAYRKQKMHKLTYV